MGKFKTAWNTVRIKMKKPPKSKQTKAFVRIVQFFAVMLVLTIFAKGAAGATMPRVTARTPNSQEIVNQITASGTVRAQGSVEIEIPAGLVVSKVNTSQSVTVKEGDTLLEFDTSTLQQEIDRQRIALKDLEIALYQLEHKEGADDSLITAAEKNLKTAQDTYNNEKAEETSLLNAYNNAKSSYESEYARFEEALAKENAYKDKPASEQDAAELARLVEERTALGSSQHEKWEAMDTAYQLYQAATRATKLAADQVDEAQDALDKAKKAYNESLELQNLTDQQNTINISLKKQEIEDQQKVINELQATLACGGELKATAEGVVINIPVTSGETTVAGQKITISVSEEGYIVECRVTQKDAGAIQIGGKVNVMRPGAYYSEEANIIQKTAPDETGYVTVKAQLPGSYWTEGETLDAAVTLSRQSYSNCVPLTAIHQNNDGSYVYVLREENTILGEQIVVHAVNVTIIAQDSTNAAIDGVYGELVLLDSTKPVNEGDKVRVEDSV